MDDLENCCFHLSRSQGVSYLKASKGDYDTMFILREVSLSSRPSVVTRRLTWMPPDGVL